MLSCEFSRARFSLIIDQQRKPQKLHAAQISVCAVVRTVVPVNPASCEIFV